MRRSHWLLGMFVLIVPLVFFGCSGDDGAQGAAGPPGPPGPPGTPGSGFVAAVNPESCAICHDDQNVRNGDAHQADYDERFQDNVFVVSNVNYAYNNNAHTVTFRMQERVTGVLQDFDCTQVFTGAPEDALGILFAEYNPATRSFDPPAPIPAGQRLSLGTQGSATTASTLTYLGNGVCSSTVNDNNAAGTVGNLSTRNGLILIYGRHDRQGNLPSPSRVVLAIHPFAALLETTGGVDYVSGATISGCEKCHTVPFLKHGYIYGRVNGNPATDFYSCKVCHADNRRAGDALSGGHFIWQLLVDNPQLIITLENQYGADWEESGDARLAPYAYRTSLMNDVHMSHAMEFAYPQSMSNCATCHAGKLTSILTDNNFVIETCKSCHPVTGGTDTLGDNDHNPATPPAFTVDTRAGSTIVKQAPALVGLLPAGAFHAPPFATPCNSCHSAGGFAPVFNTIHTGYDPEIYGDANGAKYSNAITVTIDNVAFDNATKVLTWGFHATGNLGGLSSANIRPTVLVALYGYDTKDYFVNPHDRTIDTARDLEFQQPVTPGTTHPRITITSPAAGAWNVTTNLSAWAGWIDNNIVKRVEVAVMPQLRRAVATDNVVALNAPSKTFNLRTGKIEDGARVGNALAPGHDVDFFANTIVRVAEGSSGGYVSGCNNCHDALATTFHSGDRGGNIVVCRMCHATKNPGGHIELQSRSIDSYAHAIHRFQALDIGEIDFSDPVEALEYTHHVQSNFPTFGVENCRACHNANKFNVPDQSKSLPGVLSATDVAVISNIPPSPLPLITGPATRACGACHRAEAIIANAGQGDPVKLANINSHMTTFGYMVPIEPTDPNATEPSSADIHNAWVDFVIELFAIIL